MYTLSSKLRLFAIISMVLGLVGVVYGFLSVPATVEEASEVLASHEEHHGEEASHEEANFVDEARQEHGYSENAMAHDKDMGHEAHGEGEHMEHVLHQMQTKPWSAVFVAAFFFMMIALGTLVFYAIQNAAQAGWSPVLFRVMEGITNYLLPGSVIVLLIVIFAGEHFFPWQDHELVAEDSILQEKSVYLNFPFWLIRGIIYIIGWNLYRHFARKNSLAMDTADESAN